MTPVQKLEAAITKLEGLRNVSAPAAWRVDNSLSAHVGISWDAPDFVNPYVTQGYDEHGRPDLDRDDADLIVTLHRTIDAQLNFLRDARARLLNELETNTIGTPEVHYRHPLALADAILNEES